MVQIVYDEIRESILAVAQGIFSRFGFKKTTMEDIAKAARKGKSTLYYYFKNKEEVFEAVVDYEATILAKKLQLIVDNEEIDPKEKLRQYILTRMKSFDELSNLYVTLKQDLLEQYAFVQKYRKKYDDLEISFIAKILRQGNAGNIFNVKEENLDAVAFTLSMAMKGLEIPFFTENKYAELENRLDGLMDILFYGIVIKK
jgi:AcrR family transcriptional regulator